MIVCIAGLFQNSFAFASPSEEPSALKIYVGPTSVPADKNAYTMIFVQLVNSTDTPARALQDVVVRLSSSATNIGTVDSTVTIPKGSTCIAAKFYSTYTPGTTTITATSSGYMTVQTSITTVGPVPSTLAVYACPSILPNDTTPYRVVVVQLQDSSGSPAKAPIGDVSVTLSSSSTAVGTVDPSVTIAGGSTYALATFTTTNIAGSATITAMASGYISGQASITTQKGSGPPASLKVYVGPPKLPADGVTYPQVVAIELLNAQGQVAQATSDTVVTLSSSTTNVGTVYSSITIPQSKICGFASFLSTYRSGTTTITAAASNVSSNQASLTTVGYVPSKLAVYCVPAALPADGQPYDAIQVQLQDSGGNPAKDPVGDITVYLSSSAPSAGNVSSALIIPFGKTYATGTFYSTFGASSVTITAQSSGYDSGQKPINTYLIDPSSLLVSLTADPDIIDSGSQSNITAYVTYGGKSGATGASVQFTSSKGGTFTATQDKGNGYYVAVFTSGSFSQQTSCTLMANASIAGYASVTKNAQIIVNPTASTTVSHASSGLPTTTIVAIVVVAIIIVIAVILLLFKIGVITTESDQKDYAKLAK